MNKMHTLRAVKQAIDTGSFGVLQFVQAEILAILQSVAQFEAKSQDPDRGKALFLGQLKEPTLKQEYQKIGNSFLRFVLECVEVWSGIKPYFISGDKQVKEIKSGFAILKESLKEKKVTFSEKMNYYKIEDLGKFREKFLQGLLRLREKPEEYTDYYLDYLLQKGVLSIIHNNLSSPTTSHSCKTLTLKLLTQLLNYGSINILDYFQSHILHTLLKTIKQFNITYKNKKQKMSKIQQKFYHQILKSIVLIGESCPDDPLTGEDTVVKKALKELKENGYEMPVVIELRDYKEAYQDNLNHIHQMNSMVKRSMVQQASIPAILQPIINTNNNLKLNSPAPSSKPNPSPVIPSRFPIPSLELSNPIDSILSSLKSIHYSLKSLSPSNQLQDKKYISQAISYMSNYNRNIDVILEENIQLQDFDQITTEAYQLLQKNSNIIEELRNEQVSYGNRLGAVRNLVEDQETPNSPINIVEMVMGNGGNSRDVKSIQLPESYSKPHVVIPQLRIPNNNMKVQQLSYQNKSQSSYDKNLYEQQKLNQIQIIAQYQKQHFDSRRKYQQPPRHPKSSNVLNNSSSEKSIIHNILDNSIHSQKGNRMNESLLSGGQRKAKNKIGVRRIDDSESFDDSVSMKSMIEKDKGMILGVNKMSSRGIVKSQYQGEREQHFIKDKMVESKSITGSKNILLRKEESMSYIPNSNNNRPQNLIVNNKNDEPNGMMASFGDPTFIPGNVKPHEPNFDFKKKKDLVESSAIIKKQVLLYQPLQIHSPFVQQQHKSPDDSFHYPPQSLKSIPLKSSNYLPPSSFFPKPLPQQNSQIMQPYFQPLNNSFYQPQNQLKQQIQKVSTSAVPKFNDCFQAEKYLIPSKTFGNEGKKYWLEQDAKLLTTFNFSKSMGGDKSMKSELYNTNVSIPEIISEHNKYFEMEIEGIRNQHKKEISFLENKVRKLQKGTKQQQKQLEQQKQELQSIKAGSQHNYLGRTFKSNQQQFLQLQNNILKNKLQNQTRSQFQSRNMSPFKTLSDQFPNTPSRLTLLPKGTIFPSQPYQPYLSTIPISFKKQILKNKDLLVKTDTIEIGFILSRENNCVRVALFVQSELRELVDVRMVVKGKGMGLDTIPEVFPSEVKEGKQERFVVGLFVTKELRLPYQIPQIEMSYRYYIHQHRVKNRVDPLSCRFPLPLTFNRLLQYTQLSSLKFNQLFLLNEPYILRGQQIPYNKKILKDISSIKQILLPKLVFLNPEMQSEYMEGNQILMFGVKAVYEPTGVEFLVRVNVKPGGYLYLQTVGVGRVERDRTVEQLLMCTINWLVKRERMW